MDDEFWAVASKKLRYEASTGLFYRQFKGFERPITTKDHYGYIVIDLTIAGKKKQFKAHRLAWYFRYKKWPEGEIDHKNRIKHDNRIKNLRDSTASENRANRERKPNRFGHRGITRSGKKWQAKITFQGKNIYLGSYAIKEDAIEAYKMASKLVFGEFSHLNGNSE